MDINRKIESFLTKHRYEKQKTSFTILLSVLIAFCVISSLIMPAISMTIEETQNQTAAVEEVMLLGEGETPQPPAGAIDITHVSDNSTFQVSVNSSISDKPIYSNYTYTDENGVVHEVEDCDGEITTDKDSIDLSFSMLYSGTNVVLPSEAPHLYLSLTSLMNADPNVFLDSVSKTGNIFDELNYGAEVAATYVIEDSYVKITLTDGYLAVVNSDTGDHSLQGSLEFKGELHRNNNESGDQSFAIGGQEIKVNFPDKYATLQKDAWIDSSTGEVNWTVTINKEYGASMDDYVLYDILFNENTTITYNPAGAGPDKPVSINKEVNVDTDGDGVEETITYPSEYGIEFNDNIVKNCSSITINYKTKITNNMLPETYIADGNGGSKSVTNTSQTNTAELKKYNYSKDIEKTVTFDKAPIGVDKTGTPDYQTSGGTYNNKIQWQIKITSEYGTSLNGCVIEDSNIPDTGCVVSPSGTITKNADGTWTLSGVADSDKEITITYLASASAGNNNSNTVSVTPPNGGTSVTDTGTVTYEKKSDLIIPTKSGSYDADTHTITWIVEVKANGRDTLKGYELKDDKFTGTWASSYCSYKGAWKSLNDVTNFSGNTLTVTGDVDYIQLKYTEVVEPSNPNFIETGVSTEVVGNSLDIPSVTTVTATVNAEYRNTLTKTCLNGSEESSESADDINKTLNWEADITYDGTFNSNNVYYVDTLTATNGAHIMTQEQIDAIQVRAAVGTVNSWDGTLTKGTDANSGDYHVETVTDSNGNITGFKIYFHSTFDSNNYNHVKISYTTTATADVEFTEAGQKISYEFGNNASFNGNQSGDSYTIERTNPVGDKFTSWGIYKEWDAPSDKRPEITVTVYGRVKNTGEYAVVKKGADGKFLFSGDEGYDSATPFTVTLGTGQGNQSWESVWQTIEVLQKRTEKGADGNLVTTEYEYKIIETKYGDTTIPENQSYFEYSDGMYKIEQYYNNHVKNTYYPNIDLTLQKSWSGSTLGITQVQFALYYQSGNNAPTPVKEAGDTYVFNGKDKYGNTVTGATDVVETLVADDNGNWGTPQLTGLPSSIIDENGQVQTCSYTLKEIGYYDTEWHTIEPTVFGVDTANGYFEITNPSAINTSGTLTVTNKGTADISITPQKTWTGDNGGADNIASVTVELRRSKDNGATFEKVEREDNPKTITSANDWTADAWTNLPVYELD
ncbi:MAG: hypothetical protein ACI4TG_07295, partial [Ruminococcus sp.]